MPEVRRADVRGWLGNASQALGQFQFGWQSDEVLGCTPVDVAVHESGVRRKWSSGGKLVLGFLIVIFGPTFAYLAVGALVAKWDAPRQWDRVRQGGTRNEYGEVLGGAVEMCAQREVASGLLQTALFWPGRGLWLLAFQQSPKFDPKRAEREARELEAKIAERDKAIAKLEAIMPPVAPEITQVCDE